MGAVMSLVTGIKNCEAITDLLNGIIQDTGRAIDTDNRLIWKGLLNAAEIRNEFWSDTIQAMEMLERESRENFHSFNREAVWAAREALDTDSPAHTRCMDQSHNKGRTWRLCMTIREVINSINGVDIPNK